MLHVSFLLGTSPTRPAHGPGTSGAGGVFSAPPETAIPRIRAAHEPGGTHRKKTAATYSPTSRSTIGASGLNFSVRDGKRWDTGAMAAIMTSTRAQGTRGKNTRHRTGDKPRKKHRAISSARLCRHRLCTCALSTSSSATALHGNPILRPASRLDAFSAYPIPTRIPGGIEVPNPSVDMSSWEGSACYPRSTFYPLSDGPSIRNRRITMP